MTNQYYRLPPDLAADIDVYEQEVERFLAGDLPAGILKAKRVPRGVYEQREDGTYMVRIRIAGGTLSCEQSRELAALATEFGNGLLHVTTRQDVQLHDIGIADTPRIMRRLMAVGLTSKGGGGNTVRNVTACPYAGICPHEHFDVTPCAHAVTEYLIALVGSYNLPRKYKIAFSGCAADCALAQISDLGFIADVREGKPGFRVMAGGGMGAHSRVADTLVAWVPAADIIRIAEALRRVFDKLGDRANKHRARLRYVFERLGLDATREAYHEQLAAVGGEDVPEWPGQPELNAHPAPVPPTPRTTTIGGVRCFVQRQDGFVAVPLHLPLGFVPAGDFERMGELAARFGGENGPRTTRQQNLLIRFVRGEDLPALSAELGKLDTDVLSPAPLSHFVACAGAATCRLGLCLARDAARACADKLADRPDAALDGMDVYINGCPNACGQQPIAPIGFFGAAQRVTGRLVPSYRITLGGRCDAEGARLGTAIGQIPARAMPSFLDALADDFQNGRSEGEPFSAYFDRKGADAFKTMAETYAEIPSHDADPAFYRDFGADQDFSLAGRGAGECGSGVFEVIQRDIEAARKAGQPFDRLVPTARALLITRGVDAQQPDAVFRAFEAHFIDSGLVAGTFRDLLVCARGYLQGWKTAFEGCEPAIADLLQRVEQLYGTLDANLEFHPPEEAATESKPSPAAPEPAPMVQELDLSGVACPMNFVKAKLHLEQMAVGESLAITLDDGEPVQNVPASFRNEGQAVETTTDLGNGHWRVVVKKQK
jgi:sulfite reductase (ferredoxin)